MSGGHFDYVQYRIRDIADRIERDIARALLPKPPKEHFDYWVIEVVDTPHSCHGLAYYDEFKTYKDAEDYLLTRIRGIVKSDKKKYGIGNIIDDGDIVYESKTELMNATYEGKPIPVLYAIHHCVYDDYPMDDYPLILEDKTIETMKEAYRQLRIAEIYAQRVDWMMSGDDGEDDLQKRLKEDLDEFEKELERKNWAEPYDEWNDNDD